MKQLSLDLDGSRDQFLQDVYDEGLSRYSDNQDDFPVSELDSVVISYQSPFSNGFSILNSEDNETWTVLLAEFAKLLNDKAGYIIDSDEVYEVLEEYLETKHAKNQ